MQKKKINKKTITVKELLSIISDESLRSLANDTNVDYCSKVLYGRSVFYMLLLGLLESERPSLRTMEDIFNSRRFKFLFNIHQKVSVKYNSISERLSVMDVDFFEKLFEQYYSQLSGLYSSQEILQNKIIRVDSTMVAETSSKLSAGMTVGRIGKKKESKKQVKYPFSSKYVTLQSVHSASLGFAVTCAEDGEPFVTAFKSQLQTAIVISPSCASLNLNYTEWCI